MRVPTMNTAAAVDIAVHYYRSFLHPRQNQRRIKVSLLGRSLGRLAGPLDFREQARVGLALPPAATSLGSDCRALNRSAIQVGTNTCLGCRSCPPRDDPVTGPVSRQRRADHTP